MPVALLDVELTLGLTTIEGLERYDHAEVLYRCHDAPLGVASIPLISDRLSPDELAAGMRVLNTDVVSAHWFSHHVQSAEKSTPNLNNVTVAICTRDRREDVAKCLAGLLKMPDRGQEILVVDNAPSTTATRDLVQSMAGVRYHLEARPGLDVARNSALASARGEIVAFIDDDAVPDAHWLESISKAFADSEVMCCTGLTLPLELETESQVWFEKYTSFGRGFSRRVWDGAVSNPLAVGGIGAGVNMALRKSVLDSVGSFDEALDAGTVTRSGGDHEYFARILTRGFKIVYEPAAIVRHKHRKSWQELESAVRGYGTGVYAFWTRSLVVEKELSTPLLAAGWLRWGQLPNAFKSFSTGDSRRFRLQMLELAGCLEGPLAYFKSRRARQRVLS